MKACVTWLLILLTVHAPLPCPDLDGECRGTPIDSLTEAHAWHVLLLGVQPNDDIDRGPIRPSDSEHPVTPDETPFGKLSIVGSAAPNVGELVALDDRSPFWMDHAPLMFVDSRNWSHRRLAGLAICDALVSPSCSALCLASVASFRDERRAVM